MLINFCYCSKPIQSCDNQGLCQRCGKCIHDKCKNQTSKYDINAIMCKYDKMCFNPLRYEDTLQNNGDDMFDTNMKCSYILPNQFKNSVNSGGLSFLNVNIRSISKNFEKLKECLETLDHEFTIIGISETHMKDKPLEYYHLPA